MPEVVQTKESLFSTGICGGFALRVRFTKAPNEYWSVGSLALLEPIELSIRGDIIQARAYPCDEQGECTGGFGIVRWPHFKNANDF